MNHVSTRPTDPTRGARRGTIVRAGAVLATTGLVALGAAGAAAAHVTMTPDATAAGSYAILTFSVPHGCEGSPTTKVTISVPEGINAVTPTRNSFYDVAKQTEKLSPPVTDAHGNELTERVDTVTYTATTPLPDGYRDTFELSVQLPDAAGETLAFPVVQDCVKGSTPWTEVPADGQDAEELENPAPSFVLTEADEDGGHHDDEQGADETAVGASDVEGASVEATPVGTSETDEASNGWGYAGVGVGALGLVVGGVALARSRRSA